MLICSVIKINLIVTSLFIRDKKLNSFLRKLFLFLSQSYFKVLKDVCLNTMHFFIMKIPNKKELQQIAYNYSSDIDSKDFMNHCKKCTATPY